MDIHAQHEVAVKNIASLRLPPGTVYSSSENGWHSGLCGKAPAAVLQAIVDGEILIPDDAQRVKQLLAHIGAQQTKIALLEQTLRTVIAAGVGDTGVDCGRGGGPCGRCEEKDAICANGLEKATISHTDRAPGATLVRIDREYTAELFWSNVAADPRLADVYSRIKDGKEVSVTYEELAALISVPGFAGGPAFAPTALIITHVYA